MVTAPDGITGDFDTWSRFLDNWTVWATVVTCALGGAVILHLFYRTVEDNFPSSYSTLSDAVELFLLQNALRHALFRLVPFFLVAIFVGVVARRSTQDGAAAQVAIFATVGTHIAATNARAVWATRNRRRASQLRVYHGIVAAGLIVVAVGACLTYNSFSKWVPPTEEFTVVIWTALLAAVLSIGAQRLVSMPRPDMASLLPRARQDIGQELFANIREQAERYDSDPDLLQAIVAVEVLQRPRWFRHAERLKGLVVRRGSYGIAQVTSEQPISDSESLDMLAASFRGYYPPRSGEDGNLDRPRLAARLEQHNPDSSFVSLVMRMYDELAPYAMAQSRHRAPDGRAAIEVVTVNRKGSSWVVTGTAWWSKTDAIRVRQTDGNAEHIQRVTLVGRRTTRRRWTLEAPIAVDTMFIRPTRSSDVQGIRVVVVPGEFVYN